MATIIVEDGSIVPNANSYVDVSDLEAYAADRGVALNASDLTTLLIRAMDYIEAQNFKGIKMRGDQSLQWPRSSVWIDAYQVAGNEIPNILKDAEMEAAISIDQSVDPLANIDRLESSVTVGPISVSYEKGGNATPIVRKISAKLNKLLLSTGGSFTVGRSWD
jgi:hypothetical protein